MDDLDNTLDNTTLSTISLLESRLLRIEHVLYGHSTTKPAAKTTIESLGDLERRFSKLLSDYRVYTELLRIYKSNPDLFDTSSSFDPSTLPTSVQRATVLSAASSYPSTASSLTYVSDTPIPDASLSASLTSLLPRMKGIETTQLAQAADIAELRARSEEVVRAWYERGILSYGEFVAGVEGRVEKVERDVRRLEKGREEV